MDCTPQGIIDSNPGPVAYFGPLLGATIVVLHQAANAAEEKIVLGDPDAPFIFGDPGSDIQFGIP